MGWWHALGIGSKCEPLRAASMQRAGAQFIVCRSVRAEAHVVQIEVIARQPGLIRETELQDGQVRQLECRERNLARFPLSNGRIAAARTVRGCLYGHTVRGISRGQEVDEERLVRHHRLGREDDVAVRRGVEAQRDIALAVRVYERLPAAPLLSRDLDIVAALYRRAARLRVVRCGRKRPVASPIEHAVVVDPRRRAGRDDQAARDRDAGTARAAQTRPAGRTGQLDGERLVARERSQIDDGNGERFGGRIAARPAQRAAAGREVRPRYGGAVDGGVGHADGAAGAARTVDGYRYDARGLSDAIT